MALTPFVIIVSLPKKELLFETETIVTMSAIATFSLMIKLMDWMRLFDATAFYVHLIVQTFKDIRAFFLLLMITLMLFGTPMTILDYNRDESSQVIEDEFDYWLPSMIFNQYMLALGEFETDTLPGPQASMCYTFFLLATFFSLIMILNMFIAIMGDTFERNIENKQLNNVRAKLELMGEQQNNILEHFLCTCKRKQNKDGEQNGRNKNFLFVVTPDMKEKDDLETWEGSIK